ncbi:transposase [Streptomyces sp. SCSIO 30461]|uniref:transposase n=1 Tax=Streptomyces sp. SCSIO 30461 TaxID=3118085 RepID=UPI0030CFF915
MGLHNLPSKSWTVNEAWMLTANLAADLHAWLRLLTLHDQGELADAEPDTMRFRLYHLPARLAKHARRRWPRIEHSWPWANARKLSGNAAGQIGASGRGHGVVMVRSVGQRRYEARLLGGAGTGPPVEAGRTTK